MRREMHSSNYCSTERLGRHVTEIALRMHCFNANYIQYISIFNIWRSLIYQLQFIMAINSHGNDYQEKNELVLDGISITETVTPACSIVLFTSVVVYFKSYLDKYHGELSTNIYTLFGIALAIFLGSGIR